MASTIMFALVMAAEWIVLVAGWKAHEVLVGTISVAASSVFLWQVKKHSTLRTEFCWKDVSVGWRVPWSIATDTAVVLKVLVLDFFTSRRASSLYRVSGFATSKDDPRMVARRALATLYSTASPNSVVIGIDYAQRRMLFHQLERSHVPEVAKKLGAHS